MDNVFVYDNDIVDIVDVNRLSSYPQTYQETFLEALTAGKRTASINGANASILSITAPTINVTIPAQYFAVEGRIDFHTAATPAVVHPNPGVVHDFYVYLMLRQDEVTDNRTNVNPTTFVQTPTSRIIAKSEVAEYSVLNVASGGGAPVPTIGAGVPGPGSERLGYLLRATFSWDGVATAFPVVAENSADAVRFGSSGIPPHGGTHVTTDPIPYPTDTLRGAGPPRTLSYWKNSISRVEPATGSPVTAVKIGQNGPAGDTNYDVYSAATALGFELDFDFETGSYQIVGNTFTPRFAAPGGGGVEGTSLKHSRADHEHLVLLTPNGIWKKHNDGGFTGTGETSTGFEASPVAATAVTSFGAYADRIGLLQVSLKRVPNANLRSTLQIVGGGGMTRQVAITVDPGANIVMTQSMMIFILLDGSGQVTIQGLEGPSEYKIGLVGTFGQG